MLAEFLITLHISAYRFHNLQTSYTLAWCLYNLGRNPEVQKKLRSEVQRVVGSDEMVTPAHINHMPFLRDCFKESLR